VTARILVTGASGFIGSHVAGAARRRSDLSVRLLRHRAPVPVRGPDVDVVTGQLDDPDTLRAACSGIDMIVHCASQVGGDDATTTLVNDVGTRALVDEAARSGVHRLVYVSTAAVYGRGPFTSMRPGGAPIAPLSATSRSRAAAEHHVLRAGGVVLRPHLVHGRGDRWVIPGLVGLLRALGAGLAGCRARHSLIDVRSLGRIAVAAALSPRACGVYHVAHPMPVGAATLLSTVNSALRLGWSGRISLPDARARLAGSAVASHHLEMLAVDHWFSDDRLRRDLRCSPGPGFEAAFRWHLPWYRNLPAGAGSPG
jgi:nucleoside-diphosphate-sugar epimerase